MVPSEGLLRLSAAPEPPAASPEEPFSGPTSGASRTAGGKEEQSPPSGAPLISLSDDALLLDPGHWPPPRIA
ncbi:MAG: hypothetical protein U0527_07005 [Candidatus Eisenbacteria bacterium]